MLRVSLRAVLVATICAVFGCSDPPPEPPPPPVRSAVGLEPLKWTAPGAWSMSESSPSGPRRAGYKVPKQGNDTEDAELLVLFFGTGANGERDKQWNEWFSQFDGDAKADAKRETFQTTSGATVETFEHLGTYKLNMGPQRPGMKKSPVQMVKNDFRMIGAVVKTKDRGNWFFRLVGPNETVLASKDAFKGMLESAQ